MEKHCQSKLYEIEFLIKCKSNNGRGGKTLKQPTVIHSMNPCI